MGRLTCDVPSKFGTSKLSKTPKSDESVKVTEEDYQLDGIFNMSPLI